MDIKEKVYWVVDDKIGIKILNNGLISTSFGLDIGWGVYWDFRNQSDMMDYNWNYIKLVINDKLKTYNFN